MGMEIICSPMPDQPCEAPPTGSLLAANANDKLPKQSLDLATQQSLRIPAKKISNASTEKLKSYSTLEASGYAIGPILIIASHCGSLLLLRTGISLIGISWLMGWYLIRMLAITAIYHRLLVHRSYRTPRLLLRLGCLLAASAGQMGPSWWKAHHLTHHRHSDHNRDDPHSPRLNCGGWRGFVLAQAGWLLSPAFYPSHLPADVEADPVLKAIDRLHFLPLLFICVISYILGGPMLLGAFCLSTTLLFHGVATVNSLAHLWGQRPFHTGDYSRNNRLVAFLTLGEGWHNTHHAFSYSCRHGYTLIQGKVHQLLDPTYSFILLLSRFGWVTDLKLPNHRQFMAAKRSPIEHQ
jgi:stearoyl-CoA desaturase (delta-9 desaturase)